MIFLRIFFFLIDSDINDDVNYYGDFADGTVGTDHDDNVVANQMSIGIGNELVQDPFGIEVDSFSTGDNDDEAEIILSPTHRIDVTPEKERDLIDDQIFLSLSSDDLIFSDNIESIIKIKLEQNKDNFITDKPKQLEDSQQFLEQRSQDVTFSNQPDSSKRKRDLSTEGDTFIDEQNTIFRFFKIFPSLVFATALKPSDCLSHFSSFKTYQDVVLFISEEIHKNNVITKLPQIYQDRTGSPFFYSEVQQKIIIPEVDKLRESGNLYCEGCLLPLALLSKIGFRHHHTLSIRSANSNISSFCPFKSLVYEIANYIASVNGLSSRFNQYCQGEKIGFDIISLMKFAIQDQNHFSISILQQHYGIGSEYKQNYDCFNHEGVINIISLNPVYATSFRSLVNDVVVGKFCRVWFDRGQTGKVHYLFSTFQFILK
ncbi:hypothetical protein WICMUC_004187 [Wickerhamomyces mucosus]|uniref:Uncharacterized protein n=1 Tax=Wickerhamomyces mucosus TaxID=1378264 RepID=A0A9P8TBA0_9ASCO|nr:hypothetical protein WICMUC_004187 [Wickerhamomyces mucosus]